MRTIKINMESKQLHCTKCQKVIIEKICAGAHSYKNICDLVLKAIKRKKFFIQWFEQKSAQNLQECC